MFEEYYKFAQPPFNLTPDPRFLYRSESHDVALQQVWQAIRRQEGFIVLSGESGTGKTTLCRTILEQSDRTTFTALILNPFLTVDELLREVLLSYGIASNESLRSGRLATASKHELVRTLHEFLLSLAPIHGSAVLIIDEAQHLSAEVLEEIRFLSDLDTHEQKLLQVVLVGQLELLATLRDPQLRQLNQRISIRCLLKPLNREDVEAYITHRLRVARGSTLTFTPTALDLVYDITNGVPRTINLICDRALMAAAEAKTDEIVEEFIAKGALALGVGVPSRVQRAKVVDGWTGRSASKRVAAMVVAIPALVVAIWLFVGLGLLAPVSVPAVNAPPSSTLRALAPLPQPPQGRPTLMPPPAFPGFHAVIVGTYRTPQEASAVERTLRQRDLPVYALDLRYVDGTRRRLLLGRYRSRAEAEHARSAVVTLFPDARVAHWSEEGAR